MVNGNRIYVEGGGDSKELHSRCREGFRKLLEKSLPTKGMPRIVACGGRGQTYDDFKNAQGHAGSAYIALLVDSEDPVSDGEKPWDHLRNRQADQWNRPQNATDEQVILMTTCMETWIVADRQTLRGYFRENFQFSALPALNNLEGRNRQVVHDALTHATRNCSNVYKKGKLSFEVLGKLNPEALQKHLPSFARMIRILNEKLPDRIA